MNATEDALIAAIDGARAPLPDPELIVVRYDGCEHAVIWSSGRPGSAWEAASQCLMAMATWAPEAGLAVLVDCHWKSQGAMRFIQILPANRASFDLQAAWVETNPPA